MQASTAEIVLKYYLLAIIQIMWKILNNTFNKQKDNPHGNQRLLSKTNAFAMQSSKKKRRNIALCQLTLGTQSISWVWHLSYIFVNINQCVIESKQSPRSSKILLLLTACLPVFAGFPHIQSGVLGIQPSFQAEPLCTPPHGLCSVTGKKLAALFIKKQSRKQWKRLETGL